MNRYQLGKRPKIDLKLRPGRKVKIRSGLIESLCLVSEQDIIDGFKNQIGTVLERYGNRWIIDFPTGKMQIMSRDLDIVHE